MSGSGGATCLGQNGSNNEPSGAHMRHVASCHWRRNLCSMDKGWAKSKVANEN